MREAIKLVAKEGGNVVGFVVALDRIEKMPGPREQEERVDDGEPRMSALRQIKQEFGVQTASIVTLDDLIAVLRGKGGEGDIERLEEYRRRYLASD
jgi:orotate phosphoribosyltransferase